MDSDNPTLKWSLAAVGVVVVCFCLGYFVLGSKGPAPTVQATPSLATPAPQPSNLPVTMVENQELTVQDVTEEKEAERKRKEEAERKKREAAQKAAEELATPDPDATPTPEATPNPDATPTPEPTPTPKAEATPKPEPTATPIPKATPTPKPIESKTLFRVRVGGTFKTHEEAEKTVALLQGRGYTAVIKADMRGGKKVYHVQVGAYSDEKSAERTKTEMENNGFDASIH
jgi:cell division protein FtsN